jgi:hypothetical protein
MPFGLYLTLKAGPKSRKNFARSPSGPIALAMGEFVICCSAMSIGDPCPKKKAGIFSGVEGSASNAVRHSLCVFGNDIIMLKLKRRNSVVPNVTTSTALIIRMLSLR